MGLLFLIAGVRKVMGYSGTVGYFEHLGLPFPQIVAPLVILIEIAGPILFVLGWRVREIGIAMAIYTIATGLVAHQFWVADAASYGNQLNNFFKNVSIAGGFLLAAMWPTRRN